MTNTPPPHEAQASADRAPGAGPAHAAESAAGAYDPEAAEDAALVAWNIDLLQRLAEMGMETAEELPRKAAGLTADGAEKGTAEVCVMIARAYKDVSTAIQTSVALTGKLIEDRRRRRLGLDLARAPKASGRQPEAPRTDDQAAAKPKDGIQPATPPDPMRNIARNLVRRIADQFQTGELMGNLTQLDKTPIGVAIAKIAKTLDVEIDWRQFTDEPWAQPEIARRDPRSPFAFLWAEAAKATRLDPARLKKSVWVLVDHVITGEAPEDERDDCWHDAKEMLETEFDWETETRGYGEIAVRIIRELGFPCGYAYNYHVDKNYGPATPKTAEERAEARRFRRARPPPDG